VEVTYPQSQRYDLYCPGPGDAYFEGHHKLTGIITTNGAGGTVTYNWYLEGNPELNQTVTFAAGETEKIIEKDISFPHEGDHFKTHTVQIKVSGPSAADSILIVYETRCAG